MTNKEKQLLLKVLCAGLNYDIKGRVFAETSNGEFDIMGDMIFNDEPFDVVLDEINVRNGEIRVTAIEDDETRDFIDSVQDWGEPYTIETFKPYLRPISSMTEEEKLELVTLYLERDERCRKDLRIKETELFLDSCWYVQITYKDENDEEIISTVYVGRGSFVEEIDWLTSKHFDYRGLIPMGLALLAPEGMYNN